MTEIIIRHSENKDIEAIRAIYSSEEGYSGTLQLPYSSPSLWESRLQNIPDGFYSLVAEVDGNVVGQIGLEAYQSPRRKHVANFGMAVKTGFQGKGIGSKLVSSAIHLADDWLNIKRIEITVYTDNEAAIHLYKKHGFVIEAESAAYAYRNGEYVSAYHMAKVR